MKKYRYFMVSCWRYILRGQLSIDDAKALFNNWPHDLYEKCEFLNYKDGTWHHPVMMVRNYDDDHKFSCRGNSRQQLANFRKFYPKQFISVIE